MPSCSRLSRSGLEALRQTAPLACRPSLTAARHDGVGNVQAGTERCSRPNQKITPKRRTECGQTRYPDPKTSPGGKPIVCSACHVTERRVVFIKDGRETDSPPMPMQAARRSKRALTEQD